MKVHARAKINWTLRVTGRRADGFHDLETLFQTISLHDTLTFTKAARLSLTCDDPTIPCDESNLVFRAASGAPYSIQLQKRIPHGGGLGGGSSDAAATLLAVGNPDPDFALTLGSDVPFFLTGGTAYATGRGEVLTPLRNRAGIALLLLFPEERVNTAEAYRMLRRFSPAVGIERLRDFDPLRDRDLLINDFEEPVFEKLPHLAELKQRLYDAGARWAGMTGSGSTIVGAFADVASRDAARSSFSDVRAEAAESV
ncbi:MAG TPA: 4-(cytidine 5'-diphospho)-2-C-methyl-D-erythritol kinase [Thermoanaerobaculia bacterium]|nr:4-(cytidine 5'-diphospho)-2-C-methyl-D-erythritol kinase [Thermoanaerobaculia bacterium]